MPSIDKLINDCSKLSPNSKELIDYLFQEDILQYSEKKHCDDNILMFRKVKYPLTSLIIEIIDNCNLRCIHCYGAFGKRQAVSSISYREIKELKKELDKLHTKNIALTGGEVFTHDEFEKIAKFFLENGFKLVIFTNGFDNRRLKSFLEGTKNYKFNIKISLDGLEDTHNKIRGNKYAYKNAIGALGILKEYPNVSTSISTTVMRENIEEIFGFKEYVERNYRNLSQSFNFCFPSENNDVKSAFQPRDFEYLYEKYPFLFQIVSNQKTRKFRCSGGITLAAISSNKIVKMCVAAVEEEFVLGDLNKKNLYSIWTKPNGNCKRIRREKSKGTEQCRRCDLKERCNSVNCRLLAKRYTANSRNSNPVSCFVERKATGNKQLS